MAIIVSASLYDAVKNFRSSIRVFADWVHADDKISVISSAQHRTDSVFQQRYGRCHGRDRVSEASENHVEWRDLLLDCKAGAMFLDDVEGWDAQAGAQYTIAK